MKNSSIGEAPLKVTMVVVFALKLINGGIVFRALESGLDSLTISSALSISNKSKTLFTTTQTPD